MDKLPVLKNAKEGWNSLAREQKISVGILGFCGFIALGLSFQRVVSRIRDPFTVSRKAFEASKIAVDKLAPEKRLEAESKRRDTDGDGISDYDEEKLLSTSPYLRDSDGDGVQDNVELANGQNPNCADGTACSGAMIDLKKLAEAGSPIDSLVKQNQLDSNELFATLQKGASDAKVKLAQATGSTSTLLEPDLIRDPDVIRKVLAEGGEIDAEMLAKLTDEQLLQAYDEAVLIEAKKGVALDPNLPALPENE